MGHLLKRFFLDQLTRMFPNLQKINLTNIVTVLDIAVVVAEYCPRLDTMIWNTTTTSSNFILADGGYFDPFHNLKEITLDNRCFVFNSNQRRDMADRTNTTEFLFHKFIRNVASLTYFRSDLTPENIAILQLERPEMVF